MLISFAIEAHATEPILISQATTWQAYSFEEAQFSAQFPSEPETQNRTLSIAEQSTDWTIFRVQDNTGFYAVAYTDLAPETIKLGDNMASDKEIEATL